MAVVQMLQAYASEPDEELLHQVTFWFVPMVNPDGVTLQQSGVAAFPASDRVRADTARGEPLRRWL